MKKRLCCLALAAVLLFGAACALAEGTAFTLTVQVHPDCWPSSQRTLSTGLGALAQEACVRGVLLQAGESFTLDASLCIAGEEFPFLLEGVPSHWRLTAPFFGDVPLMINNLALLEFGLKTEDHLGVPLQRALLLHPYAHASVWDVLDSAMAPLLPETYGQTILPPEKTALLLDTFCTLAEEDRTVRCYVESLGLDAAWLTETLTDALSDGLTVRREGDTLTWLTGDAPMMVFRHQPDGLSLHFTADCLTVDAAYADGPDGSLLLKLDAQGDALDTPLTLHVTGMRGEDHFQAAWLNESGLPYLTVDAALFPHADEAAPTHSPATLTGVNVLSLNGDTLAALLQEIRNPLIKNALRLVAAIPPRACQTLMDALDESGMMALITDALSGNGYEDY